MDKPTFKAGNTLDRTELANSIKNEAGVKCNAIGCDNDANDVHHLDGNHSNNDPANLAPVCKICHNLEHGITPQMTDLKLVVREMYAVQDHRKALANRLRAYKTIDRELVYMHEAEKVSVELELRLEGYVKALLKVNPFYNSWLKHVKGIGPRLAGQIIAEVGSPSRFKNVGQFWAYCGLHVVDGEAPRRKAGQTANWNQRLRTVFYLAVTQFIKAPSSYGRTLYDQYKAFYVERDGEKYAHRKAVRRVMKDFSRCMFIAWRQQLGLELPVADNRTVVMPDMWIDGEARGGLKIQFCSVPAVTNGRSHLMDESRVTLATANDTIEQAGGVLSRRGDQVNRAPASLFDS